MHAEHPLEVCEGHRAFLAQVTLVEQHVGLYIVLLSQDRQGVLQLFLDLLSHTNSVIAKAFEM